MNTVYTVNNFRIFDSKGTTIDFRPITILTGCNNSGKSSIVRSVCLLKDFCDQLLSDINNGNGIRLENYKIDFHKYPFNVMGTFRNVLHKNAEESDSANNIISFELLVPSNFLMQDVKVCLDFGSLEHDDLDNGYLKSFSIKTIDDETIFESDREGNMQFHFGIVKHRLLYFIYGIRTLYNLLDEIGSARALEREISKNVVESFNKIANEIYHIFGARGIIELLEWGTLSKNILKFNSKVVDVFSDSCSLGVYTYFPFMSKLKGLSKDKVIERIKSSIDVSILSKFDNKLLQLFLTSFEDSDSLSIHEYVSSWENDELFNSRQGNSSWAQNAFPTPCRDAGNDLFRDSIYEGCEDTIPNDATWQSTILALDLINKYLLNKKDSLLIFDIYNDDYLYCTENEIYGILDQVLKDILSHVVSGDISYSGTTNVDIKRMYSLEDKSEFVDTIKKFFDAKRIFDSEIVKNDTTIIIENFGKKIYRSEYVSGTFINKWISKFGIGSKLQIQTHADGYGVSIRIFKNEEDTTGMLLADKGYGVAQIVVILLKVEIAILTIEYTKMKNTYYKTGLSEEITQCLRPYTQLNPYTVALEEPENHVHPSLQSKLADLIVDAYSNYGVHFMVETHSEYLVRKLQLLVAEKKIDSEDVSLLYVNGADKQTYKDVVENIGINEDGNLVNEFGPGFFDESLRLSRNLIRSSRE